MQEETKAKLVGATRSKLMWLGLAITILGGVQEQWNVIAPLIVEHPKIAGMVLAAVGITIKSLRWVTTDSLADKAP